MSAVQKAVSHSLREPLAEVVAAKLDPDEVVDPELREEAEEMGRKLTASSNLEFSDPEQALVELVTVAAWATSEGALLGTSDAPIVFDVAPPPERPTVAEDEASVEPVQRWRPNPDGAIAAARGLRYLLWVVVAAVTMALGVFVLWQNDATWGSGTGLGVAVLWGLGISASGVSAAAGGATVPKAFSLNVGS